MIGRVALVKAGSSALVGWHSAPVDSAETDEDFRLA
jgi:hypothetical protein